MLYTGKAMIFWLRNGTIFLSMTVFNGVEQQTLRDTAKNAEASASEESSRVSVPKDRDAIIINETWRWGLLRKSQRALRTMGEGQNG